MVFRSIGFEARLILNKLHNEMLIKEQKPGCQAADKDNANAQVEQQDEAERGEVGIDRLCRGN
jgi:hypothetical protein